MDVATAIGVVVFGFVGVGVLLLLGIALRNTLRDPRHKQEARARVVHVAAIKPDETVLLVGQVKPSEELLTAPFSGRHCVGYQAAIENDVNPGDPDAVLGGISRDKLPATMMLEDESGSVLVRFAPSSTIGFDRGRSEAFRDVPMATVDSFLSQWNATYDNIEHGFPFGVSYPNLPADYRAVEWLLTEGAKVAVVGQVAMEPTAAGQGLGGYRKAPERMVVGAEGALATRVIVRQEEVTALD